jgi:hypothetical protein
MAPLWKRHREKLEDIVMKYPSIFGPYEKGTRDFDLPMTHRKGEYFTDNWGCVWYFLQDGLDGQVVKHALEDWRNLDDYKLPDPLKFAEKDPREDWQKIEARIKKQKEEGELTSGHGDRFFERLHFLRGFKNLMIDFMTDAPEIHKLINMIIENNMKIINKFLEVGVDFFGFGDDLGTQTSLMISPETLRKYLKPGYSIMCGAARKSGAHVRFHSDGHILEIIDDLVECGVDIINPQFRANTLDGLVKTCKGP